MMNFRQYTNLTRVVIPNNIKLSTGDFNNAFNNMSNLKTYEFNHSNVTNISATYFNCQNLTSYPVCGNKVTDMSNTYYWCRNITGSPVCGNNVTNMSNTYYWCRNITGSPVCGNNVTNMSFTYCWCRNITGSPVCGNNVTSMSCSYDECRNITGSPVCGPNVTTMFTAYRNCTNLTGHPVCGNKVILMANTYSGCTNLTGVAVCGPNVFNMYGTYYNCKNLSEGNVYFYSSRISNAANCFGAKNNSRRYNIYITANSTTLNTFLINNTKSLVGTNITWTNAGSYHYNTAYNIYIYPVTNVVAKEAEWKKSVLIDFNYVDSGNGTYTITDWKDTYQGAASTRCVIPNYDWIKY